MQILICAVGSLKTGPIKTLMDSYLKRFSWSIEIHEVVCRKALPSNLLMEAEAELLLAKIPKEATLIALDEKGKNLTSAQFANLIATQQNQGTKTLAFVIGGADGLSDRIRARANHLIAFGNLTWPHLLTRVLLVEQLYRAQQIIAGHPYHRE